MYAAQPAISTTFTLDTATLSALKQLAAAQGSSVYAVFVALYRCDAGCRVPEPESMPNAALPAWPL